MERYTFSGSHTEKMIEMLVSRPGFEPLNLLTTQVDRSGVKQTIEYKKRGVCGWFFLDSGAFSVHTGNATTTLDEYIEYVNSIDEYIDVCAQLDTIPGEFKKPKTPQDYIDSAEKSWKDFLYMREHVKSPEKVMVVWHQGESFKALDRILDYRDENGNPLDYIGISPANDRAQADKNVYLKEVFDHIKKSSNPNVKTHLYGMTSLDALSKFPCYSADSVSHRLYTGYGKVLTKNFGIISVSKQSRVVKSRSNMSFVDACDEHNRKLLEEEFAEKGFTIEEIQDDNASRVVYSMMVTLELTKPGGKYAYKEANLKRSKKLFNI